MRNLLSAWCVGDAFCRRAGFIGQADKQESVEKWHLWHAANLEQEAVMFGPLLRAARACYVEGQKSRPSTHFVDENFDLFPAVLKSCSNER